MRLTTALNEFKSARDGRFPEECRTVSGYFSGTGDRLVHVSTDGRLRDYSDSLSGLYGIDRSQLGITTGDDTRWFDDLETIRQHYYRDTDLVETEYDGGSFTIHQYDLTLGRAHVTHVEVRGAVPTDAKLVAFVTLAPEGKDSGIGALIHKGAGIDDSHVLEVYHRREHDYLTASTGLDGVQGQHPERFQEILDDDPVTFPRREPTERFDQTRLKGDFLVTAPLEAAGRGYSTTLVSQLADHDAVDRERALADLRACALDHADAEAIRAAARDRTQFDVPKSAPKAATVWTDLRVFGMLTGPAGGRIAAPEYDPFFVHSGGFGYVWFRDDAAVSRHLLAAADHLDLRQDAALERDARFLCDSQLRDGTWPHRVWADDGSLAPGWANANVEGDNGSLDYQADQTAIVTAFLATLLRERRGDLPVELRSQLRDTVADAVDALTADIADNDLPAACQNVWEDTTGQFTHTTAAFIDAFAAVARAPVADDLADRSHAAADRLLDGLEALWDDDRGAYTMRLADGDLDRRIDAGGLELAGAIESYAAIEGVTLSEDTVDRLVEHVETSLEALFRNPAESDVAGLVRYEGDVWRTAEQDAEKIWSLMTAIGALSAARTGRLLNDRGRDGDRLLDRATFLYDLLTDDGPFTTDAGYLAEQVFDDGSLDSASPLAWAHATRLHATALLDQENALPTATDTEGPGEQPTWTTGEKFGVGTVADHGDPDPSRVWFTLTEGALTEARFPQVDLMNMQALYFLVTCDDDTDYTARSHPESRPVDDTVERRVEPLDDEALLYRHVFTETGDGRGHEWTLTVDYAADPEHDAVVADVTFDAVDGQAYDIFAVADVSLTTTDPIDRGLRYGEDGDYLLTARDPRAYTAETDNEFLVDENGDAYSVSLALAARGSFDWATVGAGGSSRLDTLFREGDLPEPTGSIDDENLLLVGRFGSGTAVEETLAVGFARRADTAAALGEADGALDRPFEAIRSAYADSWRSFLEDKPLPTAVADDTALSAQYNTALMTLLAVEDKTYEGASIASPSVPWGEAVPATEPKGYGYNFVWARDLYQVFTAFEAVDELAIAASQLEYIYEHQQDETGFIPQNTYVNGVTRWGGEQMDNISFPQVMAYHLYEAGVSFEDVDYDYEHLRRSADYVARHGPETAQERWEEEAGYSPSSIAAEISGLACASKLAIETGNEADALVWLALADHWTNSVEHWTATETGTDRHTNTPYYVRVTRDGDPDAGHYRTLANDGPTLDERNVIDGGFLDLVRMGIVPADDPVVGNSVAEVDDTIRVDVGTSPGFYRYNGDGYGERSRGDPGAPWSLENRGKGRLWPLLTGERGEYELGQADPTIDPETCLRAMEAFANDGRMLPEQVWDRKPETDYGWTFGEGTGSATPLAWAMAQYVRLAHGISAGEPVETPEFVHDRFRERGIHEPDHSPALRVDTQFRGNELVVSGETTGARVAVKTPVDSTIVPAEDGEFEVALGVEPGENQVLVAAATRTDLPSAGTTVRRLRL